MSGNEGELEQLGQRKLWKIEDDEYVAQATVDSLFKNKRVYRMKKIRETEKAILFHTEDNFLNEKERYEVIVYQYEKWLPKSQITWGEDYISIPKWLFEKAFDLDNAPFLTERYTQNF
ncbi:MAG: hypothetical protein ACPLYF_03660, partial [Fervidobacterium sp.]